MPSNQILLIISFACKANEKSGPCDPNDSQQNKQRPLQTLPCKFKTVSLQQEHKTAPQTAGIKREETENGVSSARYKDPQLPNAQAHINPRLLGAL